MTTKTLTRRKATPKRKIARAYNHIRHIPKSDLAKIKAYLVGTTKSLRASATNRFNGSVDSMRDKSEDVQKYLSKRPMKTMGVSLFTGLVAGLCIGLYMNRED